MAFAPSSAGAPEFLGDAMAKYAGKGKMSKIEFYPASDQEREEVNLLANDLADVTGSNRSAVVLGEFVANHTPSTEQGKMLFRRISRDGGKVKDALSSVCSRMASGIDWRPAYGNGRAILTHIDGVMLSNDIQVDRAHPALAHMLDSLGFVVAVVEDAAKRAADEGSLDARTLACEASYGENLLREYRYGCEAGYDEPAANIARYMLANWRVLSDCQMVWRCMTSLCEASKYWPDYVALEDGGALHLRGATAAKLRLDTIDFIDRVTQEWEEEDAGRADS